MHVYAERLARMLTGRAKRAVTTVCFGITIACWNDGSMRRWI